MVWSRTHRLVTVCQVGRVNSLRTMWVWHTCRIYFSSSFFFGSIRWGLGSGEAAARASDLPLPLLRPLSPLLPLRLPPLLRLLPLLPYAFERLDLGRDVRPPSTPCRSPSCSRCAAPTRVAAVLAWIRAAPPARIVVVVHNRGFRAGGKPGVRNPGQDLWHANCEVFRRCAGMACPILVLEDDAELVADDAAALAGRGAVDAFVRARAGSMDAYNLGCMPYLARDVGGGHARLYWSRYAHAVIYTPRGRARMLRMRVRRLHDVETSARVVGYGCTAPSSRSVVATDNSHVGVTLWYALLRRRGGRRALLRGAPAHRRRRRHPALVVVAAVLGAVSTPPRLRRLALAASLSPSSRPNSPAARAATGPPPLPLFLLPSSPSSAAAAWFSGATRGTRCSRCSSEEARRPGGKRGLLPLPSRRGVATRCRAARPPRPSPPSPPPPLRPRRRWFAALHAQAQHV